MPSWYVRVCVCVGILTIMIIVTITMVLVLVLAWPPNDSHATKHQSVQWGKQLKMFQKMVGCQDAYWPQPLLVAQPWWQRFPHLAPAGRRPGSKMVRHGQGCHDTLIKTNTRYAFALHWSSVSCRIAQMAHSKNAFLHKTPSSKSRMSLLPSWSNRIEAKVFYE